MHGCGERENRLINAVHVLSLESHPEWVTLYICVKPGYQKKMRLSITIISPLPLDFYNVFFFAKTLTLLGWEEKMHAAEKKIKSIMKNQMKGENVMPKKSNSL